MKAIFHNRRGFSLLEMVVALAVLAAVVSFLAPTLLSTVNAGRSDSTATEMAMIYRAILGDQRTTFGYLGDVGDYPASLADLVVKPASNPAGWNGPYIQNPRFDGGKLVDPYGQPYEYYFVNPTSAADRLAIISRGPDGLSTNTAANPNAWANGMFTGTAEPISASYSAGANNADNIVYPALDATNTNVFNIDTLGTLTLNIQNYDSNTLVNAFTPACPNLYAVTATSLTRGTRDIDGTLYAPGFQQDLVQGVYQVIVTSQNFATAPFNEKITIIPGQTTTRSANITGLDSSGTDLFVLTVTNKQPSEAIEIYQFTTKLTAPSAGGGTTINANATKTFNVNGCAQVFAKKSGATSIRDQWIMPFGAFSKLVGASAATLTVVNNHTNDDMNVYDNSILIGTVNHKSTKAFTVGLVAGDLISLYDKKLQHALTTTLTLVAGANTLTITNSTP